MNTISLLSPIGELWISEAEGCISAVSLQKPCHAGTATELLSAAALQMNEYFNKTRREFALPLLFNTTPFYNSVWRALCDIPYGKTKTYGEIAAAVGKPKAARAVGMANHNNPLMIIVPCHRVVGAKGALTGYAGGIHVKKALLDLEQG